MLRVATSRGGRIGRERRADRAPAESPPPDLATDQALAALAALAQETRLAAYRALVEAGPAGLPAGHLAERLDVPPATLSFHLARLAQAGLVDNRRDHRQVIYAADFDRMRGLIDYLTRNCCGGDPAACLPGGACAPATARTETDR